MKRALALLVLLAATPLVAPRAQEVQKPEMAKMSLKVGDTAPDFTLLSDEWKNVKLSDFRGKKPVVLVFYPLDWSPTCTRPMTGTSVPRNHSQPVMA